jgi:hypothetical protein
MTQKERTHHMSDIDIQNWKPEFIRKIKDDWNGGCYECGGYGGLDLEEITDYISQLLKEKDDQFNKRLESKKKYWHLQYEGIDDPDEKQRRKQYNREFTDCVWSILDDLKYSPMEG